MLTVGAMIEVATLFRCRQGTMTRQGSARACETAAATASRLTRTSSSQASHTSAPLAKKSQAAVDRARPMIVAPAVTCT